MVVESCSVTEVKKEDVLNWVEGRTKITCGK